MSEANQLERSASVLEGSPYDVVIVGGGPAGLAAALALGRARRRVLVCDAGERRNAAAEEVHNFVTRDGTPPEEFRSIGREQLQRYPSVQVARESVQRVSGEKGSFQVQLGEGGVTARRVLLCTGMVDEPLPIEGFRELWGKAIFQCPYCHGWEVKDRTWGYLARTVETLPFTLMLRGWTRDVVAFTNGSFDVPAELVARLHAAEIRLERRPITKLEGAPEGLSGAVVEGGESIACQALFVHPPQRQVALVQSLELSLDADGFVQVDAMRRETSRPGIYAAGDLTSRLQAAIVAASQGMQAAAALNHELTTELVLAGAL